MTNMTLEKRVKIFDTLCERFECLRPDKLAAAYKIPTVKFKKFQLATMLYLSRLLHNQIPILEEGEFFQTFEEQLKSITNITPNGKILPKSHLTLDFNCWVRTISDILQDLNIENLLSAIRMPSLRYKAGQISENLLQRPYATEKLHAETWLGHPKNTICFHAPVIGDLENNYVEFYSHPSDYEDSWSEPVNDFNKYQEIAKQFSLLDVKPEAGNLYLFDSTSVHASKRTGPNVGPRISIEIFCLLKETSEEKKSHQKQFDTFKGDHLVEPKLYFELGKTKLFCLKNTMSGSTELRTIVDL
jgi:hypothetical protein